MEQSEITLRNKEIAQMLNWVYVSSIDVKENKYPTNIKSGWYKYIPKIAHEKLENTYYLGRNNFALKFHSDWNMLMEAVEFIEKLNHYTKIEIHGLQHGEKNPYQFRIISLNNEKVDVCGFSLNKKEAVFIAVSDFAKKFNNKEI